MIFNYFLDYHTNKNHLFFRGTSSALTSLTLVLSLSCLLLVSIKGIATVNQNSLSLLTNKKNREESAKKKSNLGSGHKSRTKLSTHDSRKKAKPKMWNTLIRDFLIGR